MTRRRLAAFLLVGHAATYVVSVAIAHSIVAVSRAIDRASS